MSTQDNCPMPEMVSKMYSDFTYPNSAQPSNVMKLLTPSSTGNGDKTSATKATPENFFQSLGMGQLVKQIESIVGIQTAPSLVQPAAKG